MSVYVQKSSDPEKICYFCEKPGAVGQAGVGDVPGVPVHLGCWLKWFNDQRDEPGPERDSSI